LDRNALSISIGISGRFAPEQVADLPRNLQYQDFHARIFSKNLTTMLAFPVHQSIEQNNNGKRLMSDNYNSRLTTIIIPEMKFF